MENHNCSVVNRLQMGQFHPFSVAMLKNPRANSIYQFHSIPYTKKTISILSIPYINTISNHHKIRYFHLIDDLFSPSNWKWQRQHAVHNSPPTRHPGPAPKGQRQRRQRQQRCSKDSKTRHVRKRGGRSDPGWDMLSKFR